VPGSGSLSAFRGDEGGAVTGGAARGAGPGFRSLGGEGGALACKGASGGGTEVVDGAPALGPSGAVSRGGLTVGGIVAGVETRSVTGDIRADLSLYPTRKPSEKKTPQTSTPTRNTRIRCRTESPLSSRRESIFITIASSGKEIQNSKAKRKWRIEKQLPRFLAALRMTAFHRFS
jgi:hypothetical protein